MSQTQPGRPRTYVLSAPHLIGATGPVLLTRTEPVGSVVVHRFGRHTIRLVLGAHLWHGVRVADPTEDNYL